MTVFKPFFPKPNLWMSCGIFQNIKKSLSIQPLFSGFKVFFVFSLVAFLTGCGSYSGSFDCPIGEGLKCASLSEVNQKVDQGALNMSFPSEKSDELCLSCKKVYWRSDLFKPRIYHRKGH